MLVYIVTGSFDIYDRFEIDERKRSCTYMVKGFFDKKKAEAKREELSKQEALSIPPRHQSKTTFKVHTLEIE